HTSFFIVWHHGPGVYSASNGKVCQTLVFGYFVMPLFQIFRLKLFLYTIFFRMNLLNSEPASSSNPKKNIEEVLCT
ncbi:hypothetical protein L9F63_013528, partial [Diploptera punctata]